MKTKLRESLGFSEGIVPSQIAVKRILEEQHENFAKKDENSFLTRLPAYSSLCTTIGSLAMQVWGSSISYSSKMSQSRIERYHKR